jgi:hypothetical protein
MSIDINVAGLVFKLRQFALLEHDGNVKRSGKKGQHDQWTGRDLLLP